MENVRAREEEARFYALEQESLRERKDTPKSVKGASLIYKLASDCGRSFMRPFWWIVAVTAGSWFCYIFLGNIYKPDDYGNSFLFTLDQVTHPFKALSFGYDEKAPPLVKCLFKKHPIVIRVFTVVQSLAAYGLLTLFFLAIRRRFKMD